MITIPDIIARGQQFGLERQDEMLQTFTGREIAIQQRPAFWSFTIPVVPRSGTEAKQWRAVMVQLANPANSFEATPPGYRGTLYSQQGGSAISADGANLGTELAYNGADASAQVFRAGEYFSVNGELKIATADSTADGSGAGTVEFEPALRNPTPDGDPIETLAPVASFRLVAPAGGWSLSPNRIHSFTLNAVETY